MTIPLTLQSQQQQQFLLLWRVQIWQLRQPPMNHQTRLKLLPETSKSWPPTSRLLYRDTITQPLKREDQCRPLNSCKTQVPELYFDAFLTISFPKGQRISELFVSEGINIFLIFVKTYVTENRHFSPKIILEKYFLLQHLSLLERNTSLQSCLTKFQGWKVPDFGSKLSSQNFVSKIGVKTSPAKFQWPLYPYIQG